ncbi:alpha-hydroxy acid oxidase [Variovorax sp. YR216]|uniref:alpha-hydroxy acid oxidase n=1 Tax=Variovorax sp. YR216 TaxID=1882828 RepID=UPI000899B8B4|nr:alpha-hydroxy acid oxidase [Variovorax sp. YR216]SDZ97291.1 (S)-mandelate dehydrogenase [Variovorax sp. YR216]
MNAFLNHAELRELARRRLPRAIFEYIDRGTEDEVGLRHNREAFDAVRIRPRVLAAGGTRSQAVTLFGQACDIPIIAAPTACAGLVRFRGEVELAKAAAANNLPFCAALEAINSLEDITEASEGNVWFQVYVWQDEQLVSALLTRAWNLGVRTLVVTLDSPVASKREYNLRNGFGMPFRFSPRNVCDVALHPRWALGVLGRYLASGSVPSYANYPAGHRDTIFASSKPLAYQDDLCWTHMRWLREQWRGNLVLKGILHPDDAVLACELGADGIVVSNHGGRTFDSAVAPIEVLPEIARAVGDRATILADSSVRRGSDVLKLIAAGAKAVMVGRVLLYGTAVGGMSGASQTIGMLRSEIDSALAMSGCKDIRNVDGSLLVGSGRLSDRC